ncbi:MAG: helix-turn-helix domain-containing protein [Cyanobacteriota bacterium]|nr:helix-turn-helix domain-containing protein [Cyanobacteriota bacterium]
MIKNEREYQVTKSWADQFARSLVAVRQNEEKKREDPDGWQLLQESYKSQLRNLQDEIAEYEALISHDPHQSVLLELNDINQLSTLLIKARIAFKLTQKELADLCDRTEEQVKAYEKNNYKNASFLDVLAVMDALGIQLRGGQFGASLDEFYKDRLAVARRSESSSARI